MNETEKQNYIRLQTAKIRLLSNIVYCANDLIYCSASNIRSISHYNTEDPEAMKSNSDLFEAIDEYKMLVNDIEELK